MEGRRGVAWVAVCVACGQSACAIDEDPRVEPARAVASTAPLTGKADSGDQADRACQVVLRSAMREPGGSDYEQDCSSGACLYVWRGSIEVGEEVDPTHSVHLLYRLSTDSSWWEIEASEVAGGAPGFRRYAFAASEHLFGPGHAVDDTAAIEMVAFLRDADGVRIFDHNRHPGDFDNAQLTVARGFSTDDGGVCQPVVGTLWFDEGWNEQAHGTRRQGGYLEVHYDLQRLPQCRNTHNGYPAWDTVAYAKFSPGEQLLSGSVREFVSQGGTPTTEAREIPWVVAIPDDATSVELWFRNSSGAGSSCEAWDSDYGNNYRFDVWPSLDHPRCLDVEQESGIRAEDYRMAHNQPHCLGYDVAEEVDADHCELYLEGFGDGYVGHYGIPFHWLLAYLRVGAVEGEVLGAGMYTRFRDASTGAPGQRFSLGIEEEPGLWRAGFADHTTTFGSSQGRSYLVDEMSFFLDLRRATGEVVRLWQSRHGQNYRLDDAFGLPTTREPIPYGFIDWASPSAGIYDARQACR